LPAPKRGRDEMSENPLKNKGFFVLLLWFLKLLQLDLKELKRGLKFPPSLWVNHLTTLTTIKAF